MADIRMRHAYQYDGVSKFCTDPIIKNKGVFVVAQLASAREQPSRRCSMQANTLAGRSSAVVVVIVVAAIPRLL
jgi:hypothetical protein